MVGGKELFGGFPLQCAEWDTMGRTESSADRGGAQHPASVADTRLSVLGRRFHLLTHSPACKPSAAFLHCVSLKTQLKAKCL